MNLPFFLARRFYKNPGKGKHISGTTLHIATAGVAAGLAVMIISVCVVLGFKGEIRSKVIGFGAHIEVLDMNAVGQPQYFPVRPSDSLIKQLERTENVHHVQRVSMTTGLLKTDENFRGISLKGAAEEYDTTFLASYLVEGNLPRFSASDSSGDILLSRQQADALGLRVGDRVYAYFFDQTLKMRRFRVSGIYQTNLAQFDKNLVFTDLKTVNQLNGWEPGQCGSLELQVNDYGRLDETNSRVSRLIAGQVGLGTGVCASYTIEELYPGIFDWLSLLDMNVWVILILMVCVAGVTMVSGLLIIILERTSTIGLLKALGADNTMIRATFIHLSVLIIVRGLIVGNVIGLGLVGLQAAFGWVRLDPANYYVDSVPVLVNGWYVLGINVATLVVTTLSLLAPSYLISRIQPAKAIRFD